MMSLSPENYWQVAAYTLAATALCLGFVACFINFVVLQPFTAAAGWFAAIRNETSLPPPPVLRFWLRPLYQKAVALEAQQRALHRQLDSLAEKKAQLASTYDCIFAAALEAVVIVDANDRIVLANSEFASIFGLSDSPVHSELHVLLPGEPVCPLVRRAFQSGRPEADLMRRKSSHKLGRPPAFEMRAVPVPSCGQISAVIVLFLPPANRIRMQQTLEAQMEKLVNLAAAMRGSNQETLPKPDPQSEDSVDVRELLAAVREDFLNRSRGRDVVIELSVPSAGGRLAADRGKLSNTLLRLLEVAMSYAEGPPGIRLSACSDRDGVDIRLELSGIVLPIQELALLTGPRPDGGAGEQPDVLGGTSAFLAVRKDLETLGAHFRLERERQRKQVAFILRFPSLSSGGSEGIVRAQESC